MARPVPTPLEGTQYLSFNAQISPEMAAHQEAPTEELEEMKGKDPALKHTWVIWEQLSAGDGKGQYADSTHRVASFGTVKSFWRFWNHMPQPSILLDGKKIVRQREGSQTIVEALMIFREGVKPEWEDELNAEGGHFQFQLRPDIGGGAIDEYWNNMVLGVIGSTIEPLDLITGIRLVDKLATRNPSIRLELWFSNFEAADKVDALKRNLESCMCTKLDGSRVTSQNLRTEKKQHKK